MPTSQLATCSPSPSAAHPRSRMAELQRQPWKKAARFNKSPSKLTFLLRALLGSQQWTSGSCGHKGNGNTVLAGVVFHANLGSPRKKAEEEASVRLGYQTMKKQKSHCRWVSTLRSAQAFQDGSTCSTDGCYGKAAAWERENGFSASLSL